MTLGIGLAGLASFYTHYYADRAAEQTGTEVAAAARLDASDQQLSQLGQLPVEEFSDTYDCPVYESYDELLEDDNVDVIVLGSLVARRADDAVTALESGTPILTGKPAAASADDASRIANAARTADLVAATTTPHRHDSRIREAQKRVTEGGVGEVLRVRTSVYHRMASPDGIEAKDGLAPGEPGPTYTMGYYTTDALLWFVGDATPMRMTGELENSNSPFMNHPDVGSATVRFEDGTIGTMTFSMCNNSGPRYGWEVEVFGTEGTIRTGQHGHEGTHWRKDNGEIIEEFGRSLDPVLDRQFDQFVDAVRAGNGHDAVPPGPAESAKGIALCDAWARTAEDGDPVMLD
ncbi:Gfo/Idh/MocA family protein [Haladaptatus halobius]|uniref:Gfo/Idh/MocA family protein n=1 Tax=Haladaptatus halobius TaxID=2884875 RepID=UPI001D0AAC2E|nr:Gfo/Idh/MocA family oxidoreductase [Haladaptatus halobius]